MFFRRPRTTDDVVRAVDEPSTQVTALNTQVYTLSTEVTGLRSDVVQERVALHNVVIDLGKALVSELSDIKT